MNQQTEQALRMAIEVMENLVKVKGRHNTEIAMNRLIDAIPKCKAALEQPCQECENLKHDLDSYMKIAHFYANQKPLSDDEIVELWGEKWSGSTEMIKNFACAIEKAHGIGVNNE